MAAKDDREGYVAKCFTEGRRNIDRFIIEEEEFVATGGYKSVIARTADENPEWFRILRCQDDDILVKEARLLHEMNHPCFPELVYIFQCKGKTRGEVDIYLVYKHDRSKTWEDASTFTTPDKDKEGCVRKLFQQMVDAVAFMHNAGWYHGHLSLDSVKIVKQSEDSDAKQADNSDVRIELSKFDDVIFYTPGDIIPEQTSRRFDTAAPEVIRGGRYMPSAADVWSLGAILLYLLSGTKVDTTTFDVVFDQALSRSVKDLLRGMLVINPDMRISVDDIRMHPWFTTDYQQLKGEPNKNRAVTKFPLDNGREEKRAGTREKMSYPLVLKYQTENVLRLVSVIRNALSNQPGAKIVFGNKEDGKEFKPEELKSDKDVYTIPLKVRDGADVPYEYDSLINVSLVIEKDNDEDKRHKATAYFIFRWFKEDAEMERPEDGKTYAKPTEEIFRKFVEYIGERINELYPDKSSSSHKAYKDFSKDPAGAKPHPGTGSIPKSPSGNGISGLGNTTGLFGSSSGPRQTGLGAFGSKPTKPGTQTGNPFG